MSRIRQVKTTFTAGEVSRTLLGRGDLRAYENGALTLRNVFIQPTGGVTRRSGLRYIDTVAGDGRLLAFEFSVEQTYLLALTEGLLSIYADGVLLTSMVAPWTAAQISQLSYTQSADTLLLVHPDVPPRRLTRQGGGVWQLLDWDFFTDANIIHQPYFKFVDTAVTVTASATSGTVTLTSSTAVFTPDHEGTRLRLAGKEVLVTDYNSPTVVTVEVIQTLSGTAPTIDWQEQAFSPVHGYPVSVAFHQDRLVLGGSRDLPNRLWLSCSGDLFNFDNGTGLDDQAIEFAILSDQVNAIRGIFSGRHLQVFTSGAEWMVTGDPLTPATVQIRRQTRTGSMTSRSIAPVTVDGATLFAARNGEQIQEFLYTDVEQAYQVTDLALVSRHIVPIPLDMDFDQRRRLLFLVREDGHFATLTVFRAEAVAAWTLHETAGQVRSVVVAGDRVFMLIQRGAAYQIEEIDDALQMDAAMTGAAPSPALVWSGLDHLEGQTVMIVADGVVVAPQLVVGGQITLAEPVQNIEVGLPYTHIIEPLPPSVLEQGGAGRAVRLVEAVFRLEQTAALRLDTGRGLRDIPLRQLGMDTILDSPPSRVSRDLRVHALGWQTDNHRPLWRIEQDMPLPFTLLSVTTELKIND
ncbi:MAG: hypothetical protein NDJ24_01980 [Alphaproteobacteria bacterium]|nr:hypothetical protein [Alphaproteobacteria bacterium]